MRRKRCAKAFGDGIQAWKASNFIETDQDRLVGHDGVLPDEATAFHTA